MKIAQSPELPDGEYSFIDTYCTDPGCGCRKTMIQVVHDGRLVSNINCGWESPEFRRSWMGSSAEDNPMPQMHGVSVDLTSPDVVGRNGVLAQFNALLNEIWVAKFNKQYSEVKAAVSGTSK